jgi:cyanophycin synthetase
MASNNNPGLVLRVLKIYYLLRRLFRKITGTEKTTYVWSRTEGYKKAWQLAADEIGAEMKELYNGIWEVSKDSKSTRIALYLAELDNPVSLKIAGNKPLSYQLMAEKGVQVPAYMIFKLNELGKVKKFMEDNPGMVVIKPASGTSSGMGVTTHIKTFSEARRAAVLAASYGKELLIERLVPGEIYRLLFLGGEMLHASRRNGMKVTGDGKSSIGELFEKENELRRKGGKQAREVVGKDRDFEATLESQGLDESTVLVAGRTVLVKSVDAPLFDNEEIRTVYDDNATNDICDAIRESSRLACEAVRSEFTGVDIITMDPTIPLSESGGVVGEINTTPGMHHHHNLGNDPDKPYAWMKTLQYLLDKSPY